MLTKHAIGSFCLMLIFAVLSGCASDSYQPLTSTGTVVVEGDSPTKIKAPEDGQVSVYDVSDDHTVWNGSIRKNQIIQLDPVNKQLSVDGKAVSTQDLHAGHTLKLMYEAAKLN